MIVVLCTLCSCSSHADEPIATEQKERKQDSEIGKKKYKEEELAGPVLEKEEKFLNVCQNGEGKVDYFCFTTDEKRARVSGVIRYSLKDNLWTKSTVYKPEADFNKKFISFSGAYYGKGDSLYLEVLNTKMAATLLKVDKRQGYKEIKLPKSGDEMLLISHLSEDNKAYISSGGIMQIYDIDKETYLSDKFENTSFLDTGYTLGSCVNSEYFYGFQNQGEKICRVNHINGELEAFPTTYLSKNSTNLLATDKFSDTKNYYLANKTGIYFYDDELKKTVMVIGTEQMKWNFDEWSMKNMYIDDEGTIWILLQYSGEDEKRLDEQKWEVFKCQ